uniref:Small ribosomal subunit protein uS15c n=1 Tax=Ilex wilsonii TaxID=185562 RepID=A0A1B1NIU1_9AQUA|nr:30S ribosomal protein S15 [Ilex wilsonii]
MVKNSFISVTSQEEKKENRGSVEFQVVSFTNKIRRLTSHLEELFISKRSTENSGKTSTAIGLFVKKNRVRYKEIIGQLDIREIKTR